MKLLKEYFDFSRGEKNVLIIMIMLILLVSGWPYFYTPVRSEDSDFSNFLNAIAIDSECSNNHLTLGSDHTSYKNIKPKRVLFRFDPNLCPAADLLSLGFPAYITKRIEKFRNAGGKFKTKRDVYKIYGIDSVLVLKLYPYISLPETETNRTEIANEKIKIKSHYKTELIEINKADTAAWVQLPGIGIKLASRIMGFREKLGGFYAVDQLKEVYGLKPETFEQIKKQISVNIDYINYLDINRMNKQELGRHPYIGYKTAEVIVNYRNQHGSFKSLEDLSELLIISEENIQKLKNYINFN